MGPFLRRVPWRPRTGVLPRALGPVFLGLLLLASFPVAPQARTAAQTVPAPMTPGGSDPATAGGVVGPLPTGPYLASVPPAWMNLSGGSATSPSPRSGAMMAYDRADGMMILFGGLIGTTTFLNDTWSYQAGIWRNLTPSLAVSPPARRGGALVFDPGGPYIVLFGGCAATGCRLNDTWTFSGGVWRPVATPIGGTPSGRGEEGGAFVASYGHVVMFGGLRAGRDLADTWAFKGTSWTNLTPSQVPPVPSPRSLVSFADDPLLGEGILFGGDSGTKRFSDTWTFQGGNWTNITGSLTSFPPLREAAPATFDMGVGGVVLYGGCNLAGCFSDTWSFNATGWARITPPAPPGPLFSPALAFDALDGYVLMFGGSHGATETGWTWAFGLPLRVTIPHAVPRNLDVAQTLNLWSNASGANGTYAWSWQGLPSGCVTQNASHLVCVPATAGTSNITVRVNASNGLTATSGWVLVVVSPAPTVTASATPTIGLAPLGVALTAVGSGGIAPASFRWSFGDGNVGIQENASHQFDLPGLYTATVWYNDSTGASGVSVVTITVVAPLTLALTLSSNATAPGTSVSLHATPAGGMGPLAWSWALNGSPLQLSSDSNLTYTPKGSGNYSFVVTAVDALGERIQARVVLTVLAPVPAPSRGGSASGGFVADLSGDPLVFIVGIAIGAVVAALVVALVMRRGRRAPAGAPALGAPPGPPSPSSEVPPGPPGPPMVPPDYGPPGAEPGSPVPTDMLPEAYPLPPPPPESPPGWSP